MSPLLSTPESRTRRRPGHVSRCVVVASSDRGTRDHQGPWQEALKGEADIEQHLLGVVAADHLQ